MKVLLIGYGSIGKRHFEVLHTLNTVTSIDVVTKHDLENIDCYLNMKDIDNLDIYDYFIIASETVKHYNQLEYICSKVKHKNILVEKPLYDKQYAKIETSNHVYVAYNLRFHSVLVKLAKLLAYEDVYYANVICGQYLPTWRPEQDYKESYSADIDQGGGVLRDLSHELDYIVWLFGHFNTLEAINTKISDLEINSDDMFTAIGITDRNIVINVSVDYISKTPIRRLLIHTKTKTIEADMITSTIVISHKDLQNKIFKLESIDRNFTYTKMHEAILTREEEDLCSFEEGSKIVDLIENIEFRKL